MVRGCFALLPLYPLPRNVSVCFQGGKAGFEELPSDCGGFAYVSASLPDFGGVRYMDFPPSSSCGSLEGRDAGGKRGSRSAGAAPVGADPRSVTRWHQTTGLGAGPAVRECGAGECGAGMRGMEQSRLGSTEHSAWPRRGRASSERGGERGRAVGCPAALPTPPGSTGPPSPGALEPSVPGASSFHLAGQQLEGYESKVFSRSRHLIYSQNGFSLAFSGRKYCVINQ